MYLLLTAIIFYTSLTDGDKSALQSGNFSLKISQILEVLTFDKVVLEDEGKNKDLFPESIKISGINEDLQIGKTYKVTCELLPKRTYELSEVILTSSDENVFTVNDRGVVTPVSVGTATLTAKDEYSKITETLTITVGSGIYVPEITFGEITGFSKEDNSVYYSQSNGASAVYALDYKHSISQSAISLSFNENECDAILATNRIYFYPKTTGDISLTITATYDNIIGKNQTTNFTKTITVLDKAMPSYSSNLNIDISNTTLRTDDKITVNANYENFANGLFDAQKRIIYETDERFVSVDLDGSNLVITPIKVGNTAVIIHYPTSSGLKTAKANLTITQGVPKIIELVPAGSYMVVAEAMVFTVVGDGQVFNANDFYWSTTGGHFRMNGELACNEKGRIVVTATHKTVEGFTVSYTIDVKHSYKTKIRKIAGHFGLFFALSLFGFVVYYRLMEAVRCKRKLTFGAIISIVAGVLTAGLSELFQSELFVAGRTASIVDVFINSGGYIFATLICIIRVILSIRRANKKLAKELGYEIVEL